MTLAIKKSVQFGLETWTIYVNDVATTHSAPSRAGAVTIAWRKFPTLAQQLTTTR